MELVSAKVATPRISVLMPVFNASRYLAEALRSVAQQTFHDLELIAIDDGSQDSSLALLKEFALVEPRMTLIARENRGLVESRNELLRASRGELVAWMDSDDVSLSHRFALQVAALDANPEVICVGGSVQCIDPAGETLNVERYPLSHEGIVGQQEVGSGFRFPTTMMRRAAAMRVGGFRGSFRIGEDFDLLLRLGEAGKLMNLPDVLYLYRQHGASVCASMAPQWYAHRDQILDLARERREQGSDRLQRGEVVEIAAAHRSPSARAVAKTYAFWAHCALQNGDRRRAIRYARSAVSADPSAWRHWANLFRMPFAKLPALDEVNASEEQAPHESS